MYLCCSAEPVFKDFWQQKFVEHNIDYTYYQKDHTKQRRGLSESKNIGCNIAQHTIVLYIDDDVVLEKEYIATLMKTWEHNTDDTLFAVGGKITNNRQQYLLETHVYNWIFGLQGDVAWDVNDVGFQVWDESVCEPQQAYYIHGGVSSYQKELLQQLLFQTFSGGRTGNEDVVQLFCAKKAGLHCIYNPNARLAHYHDLNGRDNDYKAGKKEMQNRKVMFAEHCRRDWYHKLWFTWASIGWMLRMIMILRVRYFCGMFVGFTK